MIYIPKDVDFTLFWNIAREKTESSKSGIHFGHYIAQYFCPFLTKVQVMKLNSVLSIGMPLKRWLHNLTVLLEKEFGNINIKKLRANFLFEADLNWVLKVIFAKCTMANARENNLVLPTLFVSAGSNMIRAILEKVLYTDICRTQHRNRTVVSVDLGQCYNTVGHSMCSLALQAFGVPSCWIVVHLDRCNNLSSSVCRLGSKPGAYPILFCLRFVLIRATVEYPRHAHLGIITRP